MTELNTSNPQSSNLNAPEWMSDFQRRIAMTRTPISGILELTTSCNLKCVHCYLGPQEEQRKKRSTEMSTERAKEVIDDLVASGCLYLVITGGDPMVRKDFPEIYQHARSLGLIITVFCDGILVNEKIVKLFQEYPPFSVDVSVYGATEETYEKVTRIKGSFKRFLAGLDRLREGGIPYSLKTVLMTVNQHELESMREIADKLGVRFRVDSAIFPCLPNHGHEPLDLRVEPAEAVRLELSLPGQKKQWLDYIDKHKDEAPREHLYNCGAGVTNFFIDGQGFVSPCLMTTHHRYSFEGRDFESLWNDELFRLRSLKPRADYGCNTCDMRSACTGCAAFNYLENGEEDVKSEYVCQTTQHRWNALQEARKGSSLPVLQDP